MQFIPQGPDIPARLLNAHEAGKVVFFCGAGVSIPAGAPSYEELVKKIYELRHTQPHGDEIEALKNNEFDKALGELEKRLPSGRTGMRSVLPRALKTREGREDIAIHSALMRLSCCQQPSEPKKIRLVTTNFDRLFELAGQELELQYKRHAVPYLPPNHEESWSGLVYMHGAMHGDHGEDTTENLVLTKGDYGKAYIKNRYVADFLIKLLLEHTVCFVGYSANEPLFQYLMVALAAEGNSKNSAPEKFAFCGGASEEEQQKAKSNWLKIGVTPIPYEASEACDNHSMLHKSLIRWSEIYADGASGKAKIIDEDAGKNPFDNSQGGDFIGRVLWAISDKSGIPAKRFAEMDPAPPLEWLDEFFKASESSNSSDFKVLKHKEKIDESFNKTPPNNQEREIFHPILELISDSKNTDLGKVSRQLARWLTRYLMDPDLVSILADRGGKLHKQFKNLIVDELTTARESDEHNESIAIQSEKNVIPFVPSVECSWSVLLSGCIKSKEATDVPPLRWKKRLERFGLSPSLKMELKDLLRPQATPIRQTDRYVESKNNNQTLPSRTFIWKLELATDYAREWFGVENDDIWKKALPDLHDDFQQLLNDALDLRAEIDEDKRFNLDRSPIASIIPHPHNDDAPDWAVLIELLRDAWLGILKMDPERAHTIALNWLYSGHSIYDRLALFAASQHEAIKPKSWVRWLIGDGCKRLWSRDLHREVMRLLVLKGRRLDTESQNELEKAIICGPMNISGDDDALTPEESECAIWLRLAKLSQSGQCLGSEAKRKFDGISKHHPQLLIKENDDYEILGGWITATWLSNQTEIHPENKAPRKLESLIRWLKNPPESDDIFLSAWSELCDENCDLGIDALISLSNENVWPFWVWVRTIGWCEQHEKNPDRWERLARKIYRMPDDVFGGVMHLLTKWTRKMAESQKIDEKCLLDVCDKVLDTQRYKESGVYQLNKTPFDPVTNAINNPVGNIIQALVSFYSKSDINNGLFSNRAESNLKKICDTDIAELLEGRSILAYQLPYLFRVDREWTMKRLFPIFRWENSEPEAANAWQSFLFGLKKLYPPLIEALKDEILSTVRFHDKLGEQRGRFYTFFTYVLINTMDKEFGYTSVEFRDAFKLFDIEGLEGSIHAINRALENCENDSLEKPDQFWKDKICPFWRKVWPKNIEFLSSNISESLAFICINVGNEFPSAILEFEHWLTELEHVHQAQLVTEKLLASGLITKHPRKSLVLLNKLIGEKTRATPDLSKCLEEITNADPELSQDPRYQRLLRFR